ncbi:Dopey, N-terminal-domain-containing protein [Cokeromyces recurvatus]|uniref:Dopey, N-terminal-domain-containing protein n=1 Tax=Cokeromyces recurvatus TaxID=90255 RepID=UPI00221F08CF|nr:Dopey, N-terminal-domain-containing protein [Cokeromyces recurvatus]KAI7900397.1 Dopey, N-terminal-domain-containing protein [Cokeromyces recurvatus]
MSESTELPLKDKQQEAVKQDQEQQQGQNQQEIKFNSPNLKCLVIDTNAIINGMSLRNLAEEFYTCPEVLYEVRSAHSREFLSRLPFEIKVMNPTEEALKIVTEFSKKTGDYGVLSQPDLKVLALTYTLENRENGDANIRKEPLQTRPTGALPSAPPPKPVYKKVEEKKVDEDGWEIVTKPSKSVKKYNKNTTKREPTKQEDNNNLDVDKVAESVEKVTIQEPVTEVYRTAEELVEDEEDDEDGGEWITPDNVDEYKAAEIGVTPDELKQKAKMSVGCMTADFAMQNVLLQMNLNLISAGGYRVKKIRNSVMRCHACFTVTNDMEKKFCPKCGNATLQRVTCSTNSKGEIAYHLKRNYQYRLRGTVYDIPPPKGGRKANNIVLREDQREFIKATQRKQKKTVVDMFDPDFIPLYGKTNTKEITNNMFGTDVIGYGRKNPNASKKRIAYQNDSRFRKYVQLIEKNLQSFDAVNEWADIISFLGRLLKSFQAYPQFPVIPRKQLVAKRLAQCLNPGFPAGVHQKTLEVYAYILKTIGSDQFAEDLALWSTGLFPFVQYAATHVKPQLLSIFETYYLPLRGRIRPAMRGFIIALLPALEEDGSEYFDKVN